MKIGDTIVIVEVVIDVTEVTLILSGAFEMPRTNLERPSFWEAFHRGLDARVLEAWKPSYVWRGSESNFQPYTVGEANLKAARQALSTPMDSAARWQLVVDLPPMLEIGTRYHTLDGDVRHGQE